MTLSTFLRPSARAVVTAAIAVLTAACLPPVMADAGPSAPTVEYLTRQEILTPLPLRVRLPAHYGADRVLVLFHTWGSRRWSMIELARAGQTWAGQVSCREVSTVTGDTRYFFLAFDPEGEVVLSSGSPEWPHVATIVGALAGGPQSLPSESPPIRCHDPSDCPPDFPGCPAYAFRRPACRADHDCPDSQRCAWDHYCGEPSLPEAEQPSDASDDELLAAAVRAARRRYRSASASARYESNPSAR